MEPLLNSQAILHRLLPERGGTTPVSHCITYFNNVRLPADALLGSLEAPTFDKANLQEVAWRIAIGSIATGCLAIPLMQVYVTIGTMYSLRRHVGSADQRIPIMSFRTQQIPLLTATAQVLVMQAFARRAIPLFKDTSLSLMIRHGLATVLKVVMAQHSQAAAMAISERCGAQGLFAHNQITTLHVSALEFDIYLLLDAAEDSRLQGTMRGISIAEGDILALSISEFSPD